MHLWSNLNWDEGRLRYIVMIGCSKKLEHGYKNEDSKREKIDQTIIKEGDDV